MSAEKPPVDKTTTQSKVQGEGDYESARRFREDTEKFLRKADVPELARRAAPHSQQEAAELQKAEEVGRSHRAGSKGSTAKGSTSK